MFTAEKENVILSLLCQNNCQPPTANCQLKYLSLSYRSLPVCRSPSGVRKVRATQSTILLNGKLSVRVE